MHYQNLYLNLIETARSQERVKDGSIYYEEHHIQPRCLSGSDDKENLVLLTAKEHYFAHHLLHKIYKENKSLFLAYHYMAFTKSGKITATEYENLRKLNQFYNLGERNPNYKNKQNLHGKRNHRSVQVEINGKMYESLTIASKETGISLGKIKYWVKKDNSLIKKALDMAI